MAFAPRMSLLYYLIWSFAIIVKMTKGQDINFNSNHLLSGKELKVVIAEFESTSQIYRNSTGHVIGYGGTFYEELKWLSHRLNFSFIMEPSMYDNSYGTFKNGMWSGVRGQLQREEVDLACLSFSGAAAHDILELAIYVLGDQFGILVKYPRQVTAIDGPARVFSLPVWIGVILSMIVCVGSIQLLNFLARKYFAPGNQYSSSVGDTCLYILGTLTNHSVRLRNIFRSVGVMNFTWCLATIVFVNIYSSCMSSYMSLRFQRPDVTTFRDLATHPNYLPSTLKGVTAETSFLNAKPGTTYGQIGKKMRQCTDGCSQLSYRTVAKNVLEGNFVGVVMITTADYYITRTMTNRTCQLTMGRETMPFIHLFMGVPKKSPYVMEFNKESYWWHSLGLHRYWMNKLMPVPQQCLLQYNNKGESVQLVERARLKLGQFTVAFAVLFIGYVLALVQFLRERFILRSR